MRDTSRALFTAIFICTVISVSPAAPGLPPDPGKKGEETLEGIDSNQNEVRDDVERHIGTKYTDSAKTRAALMQYAQAMQENIVAFSSKTESLANKHKVLRAFDCLVYVVGISSAATMMTEFEALVANTMPRLQAYLGSPQGTDFYRLPQAAERKLRCTFDPDALPN